MMDCVNRELSSFLQVKIKEAAGSLAPRHAQDEVYFSLIWPLVIIERLPLYDYEVYSLPELDDLFDI